MVVYFHCDMVELLRMFNHQQLSKLLIIWGGKNEVFCFQKSSRNIVELNSLSAINLTLVEGRKRDDRSPLTWCVTLSTPDAENWRKQRTVVSDSHYGNWFNISVSIERVASYRYGAVVLFWWIYKVFQKEQCIE